MLHTAGLDYLCAADDAEYVRKALSLAGDLDALANLRSSLRSVIRQSNLTSGAAVTREIEAAYRTAWHEWCAAQKHLHGKERL